MGQPNRLDDMHRATRAECAQLLVQVYRSLHVLFTQRWLRDCSEGSASAERRQQRVKSGQVRCLLVADIARRGDGNRFIFVLRKDGHFQPADRMQGKYRDRNSDGVVVKVEEGEFKVQVRAIKKSRSPIWRVVRASFRV